MTTWIPLFLNHFVQAEGIEYRASSWCKLEALGIGIRIIRLMIDSCNWKGRLVQVRRLSSTFSLAQRLNTFSSAIPRLPAILNQCSNPSNIIGLLLTRSLELGSESTQVHPSARRVDERIRIPSIPRRRQGVSMQTTLRVIG